MARQISLNGKGKSSGKWLFWGAHASRVLVAVSHRNELYLNGSTSDERPAFQITMLSQKVRDGVDAIANTRDACAPQNSQSRSESAIHLRRGASLACAKLDSLCQR